MNKSIMKSFCTKAWHLWCSLPPAHFFEMFHFLKAWHLWCSLPPALIFDIFHFLKAWHLWCSLPPALPESPSTVESI